jgi:pimeloyl-ACP methyl ester carboxylesterase
MPDELRIVVDGVTVSSRVWPCTDSTRPAAVLLPGTGATAEDWDVVAARLSERRTVFAVDLRGHGRSDWPGTYSIRLLADDVRGFLDRIEIAPVDLVGHSLGGLVALEVAAAVPGQVRRLVLEDVGMPHPRAPAPPVRPDGPLPFDWAVVEQVRPEIDDPDPQWGDLVSRIPTPTLVIGGGRDSFVPPEHIAELVGRLPDGRLATIEGGHLVHENRPDEFMHQLRDFLDD